MENKLDINKDILYQLSVVAEENPEEDFIKLLIRLDIVPEDISSLCRRKLKNETSEFTIEKVFKI